METVKKVDFEIFLKNFKQHVSKLKFKNSIQKDYILKTLYYSDEHLTAEQIVTKIKEDYNVNVGIATVYRTMKFFEDIKMIESLDVGDSTKRYELNNSIHHDHMVCTNCGKIIEFSDDMIELNQIKIAEKNGFILREHTMTIYGLCSNCTN